MLCAVCCVHAVEQEQSGLWQSLVARTAPAVQSIRAAVPEGPWKPFKLQVGWMLLLLAAKSASNRAIISRVQRTTLTPLAMQLENAERYYAQAAEVAAAAEAATAAADSRDAAAAAALNPSPGGTQAQQQQPSEALRVAAVGAAASRQPGAVPGGEPLPAVSGVSSMSHQGSLGGASEGDDELLQAEVAFLGMMSSSSRSQSLTG